VIEGDKAAALDWERGRHCWSRCPRRLRPDVELRTVSAEVAGGWRRSRESPRFRCIAAPALHHGKLTTAWLTAATTLNVASARRHRLMAGWVGSYGPTAAALNVSVACIAGPRARCVLTTTVKYASRLSAEVVGGVG